MKVRKVSLADLFPDQDYQFQLRFERGEPAHYFEPTPQHDALVSERAHWLESQAATYASLRPEGILLLNEALALATEWHGFKGPHDDSPYGQLLALGKFWEPDFLFLRLDSDQEVRLHGGCVCFPSSWRLTDKIGQPMEFIHRPVPGLNASIGAPVHKFLSQIKPGVAWQRTNWGLSASAELNQHPDRGIAPLGASGGLGDVWLRVEHQALVALPKSGGILFGIRIVMHPLADVCAEPLAAAGLRRALQTMPDDVARYKGLHEAKERIAALLRE